MYLKALLAARGPITALSMFMATATFSSGVFFVAIRNTALDCASGSATKAACAVDILSDVVSGLLATGAAAGATFIGLTSPTPRGLDGHDLVFSVDGKNISWAEGSANHRYGLNRTVDDPAVVYWQHNATSKVHKYISYEANNMLVMRHDLGITIPGGKKRADCQAYYDVSVYGDDIRGYETSKGSVSSADVETLAVVLFNYYANNQINDGCVEFQSNAAYFARFNMGASCSTSLPAVHDCYAANYDRNLLTVST